MYGSRGVPTIYGGQGVPDLYDVRGVAAMKGGQGVSAMYAVRGIHDNVYPQELAFGFCIPNDWKKMVMA